MDLNPNQRRVVEHFGKPLLVVAGAGSGKTKTLAHKVEYLIRERGLDPDSILCITFTNKASKEIAQRIERVCGVKLKWVGTFHSVAYRVLKSFLGADFSVADEADTKALLRNILRNYDIPTSEVDKVKVLISKVKEDLREISSPQLKEVFEAYQNALRGNRLYDFGDLLYELYKNLREDEVFRKKLRGKFKFILVDEYQDTNTVQYEILKLLADENICVIGDPNQCIYEWRFARPDNVIRFIEDFNPDIIKLDVNYRSKAYILSIANAILKKSRAPWSDLVPILKPTKDAGEKPPVMRFEDERKEALWIGEQIKKLRSLYSYGDMAILVRMSYLTDTIESTLFRMGIPYRVVGALRFYERAEVKNLIYFLRLLINPSDRLALERSITYLCDGVGNKTIERVRTAYERMGDLLRALESLRLPSLRVFTDIYRWALGERENYPQIIEVVLERTPYMERILKKHKGDPKERLENVKEFIRTARESLKDGLSLEDFLSEVSLMSEEKEQEDAVKIMTIHASKGLEFPVVFLPRLEEEILPHRSALESEEELEEERRLFYVAVTRAMDKLYLSYTKEDGRKPSRFLSDIPKKLLNLEHFKKRKTSYSVDLKPNRRVKEGVLVNHRVFGIGKVLEVSGERATVDFKGKIKKIHTSFLEVLD